MAFAPSGAGHVLVDSRRADDLLAAGRRDRVRHLRGGHDDGDRPALRVRELIGFFERVGAEFDCEAVGVGILDGAPWFVRFFTTSKWVYCPTS
jgi:hypothetical protein